MTFEIDNQENMPSVFNCYTDDFVVYERVEKENIHSIVDKFGLMIDNSGLRVRYIKKKKISRCYS